MVEPVSLCVGVWLVRLCVVSIETEDRGLARLFVSNVVLVLLVVTRERERRARARAQRSRGTATTTRTSRNAHINWNGLCGVLIFLNEQNPELRMQNAAF